MLDCFWYDPPYKKFREWRDGLTWNQGSILVPLRSRHLPINTHLKKIGKRESDRWDWCMEHTGRIIPEAVKHFVLDYPAYTTKEERNAQIGRGNTYKLKKIFASRRGIKALLDYLDATKRFRQMLSSLKTHPDSQQNGQCTQH